MEPTTDQKLEILNTKVDAIYASVEKTRKLLFWRTVLTVALVVLPLIGLFFALPSFISGYVTPLQQTLGQ